MYATIYKMCWSASLNKIFLPSYLIEILVHNFISEIWFDTYALDMNFCIVLQNNWDLKNHVIKYNNLYFKSIIKVIFTHKLIEVVYLDLADISFYYCDYNIIMNIFCIHIGILKRQIGRENITLPWGTVPICGV